ncbi:MAG: hypothetical protein ACK5Z2_18745 [Bacteroidota bacterium]|jgi:hypothetical protein
MKKTIIFSLCALALITSCSKENLDVVNPLDADKFPQQIIVDEENIYEREDADKVEIEVKLTDRIDISGQNPSGISIPLSEQVRVNFELSDAAGFSAWNNYILGGNAFYEIDDCTTSDDLNIDLDFQFDSNTGKGSFLFPTGTTAVVLEFELDVAVTDDNVVNTDDRGFTFSLTGLSQETSGVVVNTTLKSEFRLYDDEQVFGEWAIDHNDTTQLNGVRTLLELSDEDVSPLVSADIDGISVEITPEETKFVITLIATEVVEECSVIDTVNIEIEVEGEIDEITDDAQSGEIAFIVELENSDGTIREVEYSGEFNRSGNTLTLTLSGDDGDNQTSDITLTLTR